MKYRRLFITGLHGCGSPWLVNMLNALPGIRCLTGCLYSASVDDEHSPSLLDCVRRGIRPWVDFMAHWKGGVLGTDDVIETVNGENLLPGGIVDHIAETTARAIVRTYAEQTLASESEVLGEKTQTLYARETEALVEDNADALVIVLTRNPFDWIVSWARHYYTRRKREGASARLCPFDDADYAQLGRSIEGGSGYQTLPAATTARLSVLWSKYNNALPLLGYAENVDIITYEDLYAAPAENLASVCGRLDAEISLESVGNAVEVTSVMEDYAGYGPAPGANTQMLTPEDIEIISRITGRQPICRGQ